MVETLALLAALAFALSAVLQQRGTFNVPELSLSHPGSLLLLLRQPVWLAAFGVMALGWVLQAAALDRGRVAIVQPFLTMTIVFALPLGYWLTAQKVTRRQVIAAVVIVLGLIVFALVGDPASGNTDASRRAWVAGAVIVTALCGVALLFGDRAGPGNSAAANGAVAGAMAGLAAVMSKPVLVELHEGLSTVLADPKAYLVVIYGCLGIVFQQFGLGTGRLAPTVASSAVASPIVSVVLGALILGERLAQPTWHVLVASAGLAVACIAAIVIAFAREDDAAPGLTVEP